MIKFNIKDIDDFIKRVKKNDLFLFINTPNNLSDFILIKRIMINILNENKKVVYINDPSLIEFDRTALFDYGVSSLNNLLYLYNFQIENQTDILNSKNCDLLIIDNLYSLYEPHIYSTQAIIFDLKALCLSACVPIICNMQLSKYDCYGNLIDINKSIQSIIKSVNGYCDYIFVINDDSVIDDTNDNIDFGDNMCLRIFAKHKNTKIKYKIDYSKGTLVKCEEIY